MVVAVEYYYSVWFLRPVMAPNKNAIKSFSCNLAISLSTADNKGTILEPGVFLFQSRLQVRDGHIRKGRGESLGLF